MLTGECADEIADLLSADSAFKKDIPYTQTKNLRAATEYAASIAKSGDSVLLSPAATSYDEFKNFEERADAFLRTINDL